MRTPNTFNHTTVQNDYTFDIIRESYIALGAKRIYLKVTPFARALVIIKEKGFSIFFLCLALEKFCAYIGPLGTTEILVFNYNKIYGKGIGLIKLLHNIHDIDYNY